MEQNEKKLNVKFNILAIVCIILFCFALSPISLQNDTFYTIKIGELITQNGVDMQDHFSWHENIPYTYPHWAYDTGIYLIYHLGEMTPINNGGMWFIYLSTVILSCVLGVLIYITSTKISKDRLVSFMITLGAMYLLKDFIAARAQLVTYILFVLTFLFIETFLKSKKKRYLVLLVLISIIIANVHCAVWPFFFIIFMPYIAEYLLACILEQNIVSKVILFTKKSTIKYLNKKLEKAKTEEKKKIIQEKIEKAEEDYKKQQEIEEKIIEKNKEKRENPYKLQIRKNSAVKWLVLVVIVCAFTGLLTPIGDAPYTYLVKTMQGNTTKNISEHLPLALYTNKNILFVFAAVLGIFIFTKTKITLKDFLMISGLMLATLMSRRQISLFVLITCSIYAKLIADLFNKYDKDGTKDFSKLVVTWIGKIITLTLIIICCLSFWKPKKDSKFIDTNKYPDKAATWMLENLDVNNIKLYNEYNYGSYLLYRGIPVFIDSRADLYTPEFNKKDNDKGRDIFSDSLNISAINLFYEDKFESYGITHVIIYKNVKLNIFLSRNDKYKEIYSDEHFVIYERNV